MTEVFPIFKGKFIFAALFLLYMVIGLSGYGNDNDIYGLIYSGTNLILHGQYIPSRPPGYLVPELVIGIVSLFGGFVLSNGISTVLAILSLLLYQDILRRHFPADDACRLMLMTGLNPFFIVAASSSIDYIYSIFFILAATSCYLNKRSYWGGGVLLALAVGSRLSNSLIVAIICMYFLYESHSKNAPTELHERFASMCLAGVLSALLYLPSFVEYNNSMGFLTYAIADFSWKDQFVRLVYKSVYLFGILPICVFVTSFIIAYRNSLFALPKTPPLIFGLAIVLAQVSLFYKIPLEISYLLPILFVVFPLWLVITQPTPALQKTMLVAILIYGFVFNIELLQITYFPGNVLAADAQLNPYLEKGVVVNDLLIRDQAATRWAPIGAQRFFDR